MMTIAMATAGMGCESIKRADAVLPEIDAAAGDAADAGDAAVSQGRAGPLDLASADAALNDVWPRVVAYYNSPDQGVGAKAVAAIQTAQDAWLLFRDAECKALKGGEECLARLTSKRVAELTRFIDSTKAPEPFSEATKTALKQYLTPKCASEVSGAGLLTCARAVHDAVDDELNARYQKARKSTQFDTSQLVKAELAWITIRDKDCAALYASLDPATAEFETRVLRCKTAKTYERFEELFAYLVE